MSVFEICMLLCFAAAWPVSIYKSYKSRTAKGKSVVFLIILLVGYVMGMLHKVFYNFDYVIIMYAINFCLVFTDIMLYIRNRKLDIAREEEVMELNRSDLQ
ncbi:MAG: hypothetical protein ACOYJB_08530 [Christensenellaceae bacterium]